MASTAARAVASLASAEYVVAADSCARRNSDGGRCMHKASICSADVEDSQGIVLLVESSSASVVKGLSYDCCC
jgi:hypothetical protein